MMKSNELLKLRKKAEEFFQTNVVDKKFTSIDDLEKLLQELNIYHIELEVQNDELTATRDKLQISQKRYSDLYNNAPIIYLTLDEKLHIIEINKAGIDKFALDKKSLINKDFRKFVHPESQDEIYFLISNSKIDENQSIIIKLVDKNSIVFDAQVELSLDNNSDAIEYHCAIIDITKWKDKERELYLAKERFEFLESLPDPVIVHINGSTIYANKEAQNFFFLDKQTSVGANIIDYIADYHKQIVIDNMTNKMQGLPFQTNYEIDVINSKNEIRNVNVNITFVDHEGKSAEIIVIRDISKRKKDEKILKSYSAFRGVISAVRSIDIDSSEQDLIQTFVEAISKEYGINKLWFGFCKNNVIIPEYIIGEETSIFKNLTFSVKEDIDKKNCPAIISKTKLTDYYEINHKSTKSKSEDSILKSFLTFNSYGFPLNKHEDFNGIMVIYLSNNQYIDEDTLEKIAMLIKEFELIISIRRKREELQNELKLAKEKAEASNRAKTEFLSNMSHEIRSPLNPIVGFTNYLLNDHNLPSEVEEIVRMIQNSSKHLLKIINDILDMSKLEMGKIFLEESEFNFKDYLNKLVDGFTKRANSLKYSFTSYIDPNIPDTIIGDSFRLNQIISNIIDNAFKFSYKSDSEIKFKVENITNSTAHDRDQVILRFKIEDQGIGIAPDKIGKIFDMFSQGDSSFTKRHGGTGLGLTIAKELCELMDGKISVQSIESLGSIFEIKIPFRLSITQHEDKNTNLKKIKIMIAEDDPTNLFLLDNILSKNPKYSTKVAKTGQEALDLFTNEEFHIVLMDVKMPVMDGVQATRKIRDFEKKLNKPAIPIIGVTAHATMGSKEEFVRAGMDYVLHKPFVNSELMRLVENYSQFYISKIKMDGGEL